MNAATFIVAGALDQRTGGYIYDSAIVTALRAAGWSVEVMELAGRFPWPDRIAAEALDRALADLAADRGADRHVVIDALACGALPDVVERYAESLQLSVLVHHPLADETGLDTHTVAALLERERRVLACASSIITTSAFTAARLREMGLTDRQARVVEPGVERRSLARGHGAAECRLLCVATLVPRKGHLILIQALARLAARNWICDFVGDERRDPEHAARLRQAIADAGLEARIRVHGELDATTLAARYDQADLFVLASHYEGYGMVISEAIAHGLPVVTTSGGALGQTLPADCGVAVAPGDVGALADALAAMIDNPDQRASAAAAAQRVRERLSSWQTAGNAFAAALAGTTEQSVRA